MTIFKIDLEYVPEVKKNISNGYNIEYILD